MTTSKSNYAISLRYSKKKVVLRFSAALLALTFVGFLLARDALARFAWERYGRADIALALNRSDADLAMQLGTYYFAGTAGRSEYDLSKAKRSFQRAVNHEPTILWGHYQLARIYFVEGNYA
ncbi:hypothetical protein C4552_01085, partial [Candidatus Parcubacteria bacterium]